MSLKDGGMGKWIAFFSQTGSEIAEVSKQIGRWPDVIITNQRPTRFRKINEEVLSKNIITLPNKPTVEDYRRLHMSAGKTKSIRRNFSTRTIFHYFLMYY